MTFKQLSLGDIRDQLFYNEKGGHKFIEENIKIS